MQNISVILASASPRRRELLTRLGLDFTVIPAHGEERITSDDPIQAVQELAAQKASEVMASTETPGAIAAQEVSEAAAAQEAAGAAGHVPPEPVLIIGADTIVVKDGQILGKPKDEADAFRMLRSLQGDVHQVYTGVSLILREEEREHTVTFYEMTRVYFGPMTDAQIRAYIATGDPMDKAGAYGIQSGGGTYISRIEGDYDNVVGLPVTRLQRELNRLGVRTEAGWASQADRQSESQVKEQTQMQPEFLLKMPGPADGQRLRYPTVQARYPESERRAEALREDAGIKTNLQALAAARRFHTPRPPVPRRENAVILPLIETEDGYDILFEMRALDLKHQPGDICLPGGRIEAGEQPVEAALREASEELLVQREQIRVLFPMDGMIGPGERTVWPFAAVLSGYQGTFSPEEVDHTFRIPLFWFLMHPPKVYRGRRTTEAPADFPYERIAGGRDYWKGGYEYDILVYGNEGTAIWGITARVVEAFIRLYGGGEPGAPI